MMNYFVTGNLKHNGKRYKRGDTVELSNETAAPLLQVGVIQTEAGKRDPEPVVVEPEVEQKPEPIVGGEQTSTGEPSIDGRPDGKSLEATDITPVVDPAPEAVVVDPSADL